MSKERIIALKAVGESVEIITKQDTYKFTRADEMVSNVRVGGYIEFKILNRGFDKITLYDVDGNETFSGERLAPHTRI